MRLVLDTNILVSAFLWGGLPSELLRIGYTEGSRLFTSGPLLEELREVLIRPKFEEQFAGLPYTVDELIEVYESLTVCVSPEPVTRTAPDPDDDVVIGTALAASADLIVTGDRGLLSVSTFERGRIVTVATAMRLLGHASM